MRLKILISGIILLIIALVFIQTRPLGQSPVESVQPVMVDIAVEPAASLPQLPYLPKAAIGPKSPNGAMEGQRVLVFKDKDALEAFLKRAGSGVHILGRIDGLNALRVAYSDYGKLKSAMGDDADETYVFPINIPPVQSVVAQPGAVPLGDQLLRWLGVNESNANWGKGVKVAVLDTGVTSSFTYGTIDNEIVIVPHGSNPSEQNGHGTAVASTIKGSHLMAPGVAPGVELLSIRVANDAGQSDSFLLADGIVKAVDAGAQLINISMGGFGDSQIIRDAVEYAEVNGALVIAAVGNNGGDQITYPAAIDSVVGVGAVDALGNHLNFSNSGNGVDIAAPGYEVNAAWIDNQVTRVSGTSFSAPIVTGAIAAVMTEAGGSPLSPRDALKLMQQYLNDGASAGVDSKLGAGMPDLGRVFERDVAGLHDAALAALTLLPPDSNNPFGKVEILVQNRGTEPLINTTVTVNAPSGRSMINITSMAPGGVKAVQVPVTKDLMSGADAFMLRTEVKIANGLDDHKPENNQRSVSYIRLDH